MSAKSDDNQAGVDRIEKAMPSLQLLEGSLRSKRDLGKLLGVHVQPGDRGRQIADGYVRLVEKALLEYQESRATLIAFLADGTADHQHRAQDHFESCIQSLHRAILYLERLRRLGYRRADGAAFIPRPRELEVLRDSVKSQVREMRDAVEHLDNDILDGRLPETATVGIHLGWEKASLGSFQLDYADVARWIEQLHEFAALLSRVHLVVAQRQTQPMPPNARFAAALNSVASLRCFGPVNRIRKEPTKEQEASLHVGAIDSER